MKLSSFFVKTKGVFTTLMAVSPINTPDAATVPRVALAAYFSAFYSFERSLLISFKTDT